MPALPLQHPSVSAFHEGKPALMVGHVPLSTNLLLAPIAGYCDLAFRLTARSCGGIGLACTDLLNPEGVLRETRRSMVLASTNDDDRPLTMQLYGADPDRLAEAGRWAEDRGATIVDLNMGCPVDKITKRDGGSKLLCDPDRTLRIVEGIKKGLRTVPLTCKLRLGWDDSCIVAPRLARQLEDIGVAMITIHGRTTEMKFSGQARLDGIAEVVAAVKHIPVIGNGDVRSIDDAVRMFAHTRCAGIMIGRGALSRPWIFNEIWTYLTTGHRLPEPAITFKTALLRKHFGLLMAERGERVAVLEFRKRISWYAKFMHPCDRLSQPMRLMNSADEFYRLVNEFEQWRLDWNSRDPAAMPQSATASEPSAITV